MGQEGGEAKIASAWPPGRGTVPGRSLNPGSSVNAHSVQAPVLKRLAADEQARRRSVPPSLPEPMSLSLNQRWRERPRCPASRLTPGRRDGVVHAIVGRVARRRFRAVNAQDERAVRVHVLEAIFAGTIWLPNRSRNLFGCVECIPGRTVTVADPDPGVAPSHS